MMDSAPAIPQEAVVGATELFVMAGAVGLVALAVFLRSWFDDRGM